MSSSAAPALSVHALFAERDEKRRREREADELLRQKQQEELAAFRKRLDEFELTDERIAAFAGRVTSAFERGETELMISSFPSSFCTDNGRAVNNADVPPINRGKAEEAGAPREPEWLATLPRGVRVVYEYWEKNLKPNGFGFSARVINFPGGMPGDIGLFVSWPKSLADMEHK